MIIDRARALELFQTLSAGARTPCLHPNYLSIDALRDSSLQPTYFLFQSADQTFLHPFHYAKIPGTDFYDVQSAYGYGGPVASSMDSGFLSTAWEAYANWCKENQVLAEFIRFHPILANSIGYPGDVVNVRNHVRVQLSDAVQGKGIEKRARTLLKKAENSNLEVRWAKPAEFIPEFKRLYSETMARLQADQFYFFPDSYIEELCRWDVAHLALVQSDGIVSAAAIFLIEGETAEYFLSASDDSARKTGAVTLALQKAFHRALEAGCKHMHLGGGTSSDTTDSLLFFKMGFSPILAPFQFGKRIYNKDEYDRVKSAWERKTGKSAQRVLFYRE